MLFRQIYDETLAQGAYLIGCQKTGEAIIIDPERDVDRYQAIARKEGLRIVAVAETHIHADYLSGARELAEQGAKLYISGMGGPDWNYRWLDKKSGSTPEQPIWYDHVELKDGSTFKVGNIQFKAIHTPGHTPEHICFLVTDLGAGATEPMGIATGDFVFVGDVGRPDLLESAAGQHGMAASSAKILHHSITKFLDLPEYLQVWPAHGSGSACGKALGAVPQTTVGYEKRFNPALKAATTENTFTDYVLSDQPDPPSYFARMKFENRDGPAILGSLPKPLKIDAKQLATLDTQKVALVDTRPWDQFASGHIKGSLSLLINTQFPTEGGSLIDPAEDVVLIIEPSKLDEAIRDLVRVGIDRIVGWATPDVVVEAAASGVNLATIAEISATDAKARIAKGKTFVLDVRKLGEHTEARVADHPAGLMNVSHTRLATALDQIPKDADILVHCRGGVRSARACAYLQRRGHTVTNMAGGFMAWEKAGGSVERGAK
ncbi:MAG: MBL fold metallo-hydrolase [Phycisphaeraceae bacterium]|nr:MBL fold metallo-hydrolase [Phycisphaeraceae bacterium]